mmetsp:Transcript_28140/g.44632  ORF Transcript_28140/g.44632 Transcript_28140/m.44632 type:complete len:156 (+) Transcript_28140:1-468(+)
MRDENYLRNLLLEEQRLQEMDRVQSMSDEVSGDIQESALRVSAAMSMSNISDNDVVAGMLTNPGFLPAAGRSPPPPTRVQIDMDELGHPRVPPEGGQDHDEESELEQMYEEPADDGQPMDSTTAVLNGIEDGDPAVTGNVVVLPSTNAMQTTNEQ